MSLLESARAHWPNSEASATEKESIHKDLVAANVILKHIQEQVPYDEDDQEFHDLRQIRSAVARAQEFLR